MLMCSLLTIGHTDFVQHQGNTGDHPPIKQHAQRVPFFYREKITTMMDEMEAMGVIRLSSSPWASPVVLVASKLNNVTKKDVYPG